MRDWLIEKLGGYTSKEMNRQFVYYNNLLTNYRKVVIERDKLKKKKEITRVKG